MPSTPRLIAARRVLDHFYWTKMRARRGPVAVDVPGGPRIEILSLVARDARMRIAARAAGPVRLTSDAGMALARPDAGGRIEVELAAMRHLVWHDDARGLSRPLPVYRRRDHLRAALAAALDLATFPLRHGADIWAYFRHGDSAAGDRMERALLPLLVAPETLAQATDGFFGAAPMPVVSDAVTIVLPVYDAAEVLAECLANLAAHTPEPHRVVIVNDASPDPRIAPMLAGFASRHPGATVLTNPGNIGFIGSVNRGLASARGHVVLLNSDALVPPGWLTRLMAPLLADAGIASVTPLSNDAEIFGAPVECRPRVLSAGEAEGADRAAARLDWRVARAEAPTGVGFCMAMARPWLDRIPAFDTAFGRGYGEEVDWCRKTAALGARHLGLATLFVEHRAGSSFGAEKAARVAANNRLVAARYPTYDLSVARWREADPLLGPRIAVGLGLIAGGLGGAALPVYLAHRLGGGAEHWLRDRIAEHVGQGGGALVLRDDPDSGRVLAELHCAQGVTRGLLAPGDAQALLAIPPRIELIYSCLVEAADPLGFATGFADRLRPGDGLALLFHDFLPLCPSYCLVSAAGRSCGLPGPAACQACYGALPVTSGARPATIAAWRAGWRALAERAGRLVVFSQDSRRQVLRVWPEMAAKIAVVPHRIGHLPRTVRPAGPRTAVGTVLGVLGGIGRQKGAGVLRDLADRADPGLRIVVIGQIDPAYAHPGITVHGAYDRDEIAALAERHGIDCWLIPSIWPETFCYTVHEALATGLPVFAFDIGAQGDAVRAAPNGRLLPLGRGLSAADFRPLVAAAE
ncbi:glycosyltransferase [Frigidibacter sp. MR17.24]|uniref:glycosyltransferase n=1 Tax=Frigidibacter sp. MR17.24 TaxID=3127345 RepID=UPI0030131274